MWIARDADDGLYVYLKKPVKKEKKGIWGLEDYAHECNVFQIYSNIFPDVKWEDSEPRELVLK